MGCCSVRCAANFAMVILVLGLGAHIAGMLTDYWCVASRDQTGNETDTLPTNVRMGLFGETVEYGNGTEVKTDSSLNLKEEQYLIISIAGVNCLFCLILCVKAIHILVGVSSFIIMTLMLLCAFYSFEHTNANMHKLQEFYPTLPTLSLSWSFYLVFGGIILNIVGTSVFISLILYKGEREASTSSKGLGPKEIKDSPKQTNTKASEKHVYENTAYKTEGSGKLDIAASSPSTAPLNGGHPVSHTIELDSIQMHETVGHKTEKDRESVDSHTDVKQPEIVVYEPDQSYVDGEPATDVYDVESDTSNVGIELDNIVESSRL